MNHQTTINFQKTALGLGLCLLLSAESAQSAVFAVNFSGSTPTNVTINTVLFTPNVNAVDVTNAAGASGTISNVGLGAGSTTTWSSNATYSATGFNLLMGEGQALEGGLAGSLGTDIIVTFNDMNNVSYDYDVTLLSSQAVGSTGFLTAVLTYGVTNVNLPFTVIPTGGTSANPGNIFGLTDPVTGPGGSENLSANSFSIRISGADSPGAIRNALAAIAIDYRGVPEPATMTLAGIALMGLLGRRRRA